MDRGSIKSPDLRTLITARVHQAYWVDDITCQHATIRILGELHNLEIHPQVYAALRGFNGAGKYGAQCGLVEGTLAIIGLLAAREGLNRDAVNQVCHNYAAEFEKRFGSLLCRELRPEGFGDNLPPHLCEKRSVEAILFAAEFLADIFS